MRILQLVHQYPPEQIGGSELYTHQLTQGLIGRGHDVAIFTRRNRKGSGWKREAYEDVPIYAAWAGEMSPAQRYLTSLRSPVLVESFAQVLDQFQPEMIHVQHLMGLPLELISVIDARKLPFLLSLHDYWWVCSNANLITNYSGKQCAGPRAQLNCAHCVVARAGGGKAWAAYPAIWAIQQWRANQLPKIMAAATAILVPSEFVRTWYLQQGMAADSIVTLPLGVESPPVHFQGHPVKSTKPLRFLYLGGIAAIKGVHVIVEAMRTITGNVELQIAGDTAIDPDYANRIRSLATANVQFLGKLSRAQVWQTLCEADALLVPSLSHESYCFSAREAQSVGTPLLASAMGALSEIVINGTNGLLLPAGDVAAWQRAMQECVDQPQKLIDFRTKAIKPLPVDAHIERMIALYQASAARQK